MFKLKIKKIAQSFPRNLLLSTFCLGMLATSTIADAYETKNVFKTKHFSLNQVVLEDGETLDAALQSSITADIQTQNRLEKVYQSTTVIFPAGSRGFTGKINTPTLAVLSISNYDSGKDRISFNRKANYLTTGGIYFSFKQIVEMVNRKDLNILLPELAQIPIIITDLPVTKVGLDPTNPRAVFVTSADRAAIFDLRIDDSVYYSKETYAKLNNSCKISVLTFVDRILPDNIPLYIAGRAALNSIHCTK